MPSRAAASTEGRARTERGERSRGAILDAAKALFSERGYDRASMATVASEAGLSKSVIYDHFDSKADLQRALLEREAEALLSYLAASVPGPAEASAEQRLRAGVEAFFRYAEDQPVAWRLLIRDAPTEPALTATHAEIQRRGTEAVALLIGGASLAAGSKRRHKEMLAEMIKSSVIGLAAWWSHHPEVARDEMVDTVIEFVWPALRGRGGADT
ncbi:MAG TPA: TetR/AcrR family transcriptional regulator [Thermoleophilaceae bacterium]|jgi:AcrR family transcriptional regulator